MNSSITLYHAPRSRSLTVYYMLEELGVPYDLHLLNLRRADQKKPEFLAVNPMGKVPALKCGDEIITEAPAICVYLAEKFPDKGLDVPMASGQRGEYLKWMFFATACFEPAIIDHLFKRDNPDPGSLGYGTLGTMLRTMEGVLSEREWLLGKDFTAADVVIGSSVYWAKMTGAIKEGSVLDKYALKVAGREAHQRTCAADIELFEKQQQE